jgi:hypothetical protein
MYHILKIFLNKTVLYKSNIKYNVYIFIYLICKYNLFNVKNHLNLLILSHI